MPQIHPTAVIEDGARVGEGVEIGAYCVIGADVEIQDGTRILPHVVISGHTTIGSSCMLYPFSSIGHAPQDLKFKGEHSRLEIGSRTVIRESVTLNPGTKDGGMLTRVGQDCLLMAGVHIAHDCKVGDNVIFANNATLGGHVEVGDHAVLGGLCAVHQKVRIGEHSIVGGLSGVEFDVIPFGSVLGDRASLVGLNIVGLKRRGFPREQIHGLRNAYKLLFKKDGILKEQIELVKKEHSNQPLVKKILSFMTEATSRGFCVPKQSKPAESNGNRF